MAVAAAAESVTSESAEQVRVVAENGSAFIASGPSPSLRENSSATMRCGTLMPSPMKRMTFLGACANSAPAHSANAGKSIFFMVLIISYPRRCKQC